jgi:hypothetical protein
MKTTVIIMAAMAACACAQIAPSHEIPVKPDHINAGIEAGDTVEITTKDGETRKFVVKEVGTNSIEGPSETIPFSQISKLVKRSFEAPTHPCAVGVEVGCSIPEVVLLLSSEYEEQAEKFHPACVTHDFCYRHGFATYGASRDECDNTFYDNMKAACGGTFSIIVVDFEQSAICNLAARQTFNVVRTYGEKHYQSSGGSYCEYRDNP